MSYASALFKLCVRAIGDGELIEREGRSDKEFHFQNWFSRRLNSLGVHYDQPGRNTYPDFRLVGHAEGYEVKGLAYPGREADYDCNSQVPCGQHNGRKCVRVRTLSGRARWQHMPRCWTSFFAGSFRTRTTTTSTRTRAFEASGAMGIFSFGIERCRSADAVRWSKELHTGGH